MSLRKVMSFVKESNSHEVRPFKLKHVLDVRIVLLNEWQVDLLRGGYMS